MASLIFEQAHRRQPNIGQQFVRILIGIGPAFVSCLQSLADLAEEHPVRHAIVPCGPERFCCRQNRRVGFDARSQSVAHFDAICTLAQGFRQLPALCEISRHDQLLVPVQGFANGLAVYIRVAVHIAAHP